MAKRGNLKRKVKNTSRFSKYFIISLAIILVIAFITVLILLVKNNKGNVVKTVEPIITEKPQITLPNKPEERYTYIQELENPGNDQLKVNHNSKSAEKERQNILNTFSQDSSHRSDEVKSNNIANKKEAKSNSKSTNKNNQSIEKSSDSNITQNIWIQCGIFKEKSNAESLKAILALNGVNGVVKKENLYRVIAGSFSSPSEANETILRLKNSHSANCIISK